MTDSILTSIKGLLGVDESVTAFDQDIIIAINTAFNYLNQVGVGPETGFSITDDSAVWTDFLGVATDLEAVKTYAYLRAKLLFDPPLNAFLVDAIKEQLVELIWRLQIQVMPPATE